MEICNVNVKLFVVCFWWVKDIILSSVKFVLMWLTSQYVLVTALSSIIRLQRTIITLYAINWPQCWKFLKQTTRYIWDIFNINSMFFYLSIFISHVAGATILTQQIDFFVIGCSFVQVNLLSFKFLVQFWHGMVCLRLVIDGSVEEALLRICRKSLKSKKSRYNKTKQTFRWTDYKITKISSVDGKKVVRNNWR